MIDAPPRAWHEETKQMFRVHTVCWKQNGNMVSHVVVHGFKSAVGESQITFSVPSEVILLQPTGLKDKNGEMIYQKDLLSWYESAPWDEQVLIRRTETVNWVAGRFVVGIVDLCDLHNISVIIGNELESPELLEEKP